MSLDTQIPALQIKPERLMGSQFTTYKIGGPLAEAYQPTTMADAVSILKHAVGSGKALTILGWGGNSLIASAGISGITLITRKMGWVNPINETELEFGAGVHLAKAATEALNHRLQGGEFMIGIPGTIGGAVRMNAGALSQEMANLVQSAQVFDLQTGETQTWTREQLGFAYRKSNINPAQHVVLSARLKFQPGDPESIQAIMDKSVNFRRSHHPLEPNGGSVFKNPTPDQPMGKLIEELGGKDWTEGGVRISPRHGNFIINLGTGTSTDVLKLMLRMKREVKARYNLDTHPENLFLGDATEEENKLWQELTQ